jgi:hypothetical protein
VGTGIFSNANTSAINARTGGDAGSIDVIASGAVSVVNAGQISSSTSTSGRAGSVLVRAGTFSGDSDGFVAWIGERTQSLVHAYDLEIRDADLETVCEFMQAKARRPLPFPSPDRSADNQRMSLDLVLPFMDEDWNHP